MAVKVAQIGIELIIPAFACEEIANCAVGSIVIGVIVAVAEVQQDAVLDHHVIARLQPCVEKLQNGAGVLVKVAGILHNQPGARAGRKKLWCQDGAAIGRTSG